MTEITKKCVDCKQELPVAEFYVANDNYLRPRCTACRAAALAKKNK